MTVTYYFHENAKPNVVRNVTGFVIGFDYKTGKLMYTFWHIPRNEITISLPITATIVVSNGD